MNRPIDAVIEFLEAEQARGRSHVFLDDGARDGLRELFRKSTLDAKKSDAIPATDTVSPVVQLPSSTPLIITPTGTKAERLESLRTQAESWPPARSLGTLRETMVFSSGSADARIMLVSEAPGYEEEKQRELFVGAAGGKLDDILKAMGITRHEVYMTCIVKFRPATARQATNNRKPSPDEIAACLPLIRAELDIVRPECVIVLGDPAGLLGPSGTIASMRGRWHDFEGYPVRVTYHPSYLLQSTATHSVKRQAWEDMMEVMTRLGMPISDKQRGYFLPKT